MAKKCLFSKSTENLNTSVTVECSLGPITVCICDEELHRPLSEVSEGVTKLIEQAEELAETFGFDLEEAIAKGGMMTIGGPDKGQPKGNEVPLPDARVSPVASPSPGGMRMQEIPQRVPEVEEIEGEASETPSEAPPAQAVAAPVRSAPPATSPVIQEAVAAGEKVQVKKRVQSPNGRQFELPERTVDETGETVIAIDTQSEKKFNDQWERMVREGKDQGSTGASYKDGYGVQFMPCKLCVKNGTPTGVVSGQTCPKCKGAGEIMVTR
jgi:hypothetical protein